MTPSELETKIVGYLRRYQLMYLYGGVAMFVLGIFFALVMGKPAKPGGQFYVFGMFALVGIGLCIPAMFDPRKSSLMRRLAEKGAASIVWLYILDLGGRNKGAQVIVAFADGTRETANTIGTDADQLLALFAQLAPHATLHWTEELEARYTSAPGTLAGGSLAAAG
jgi:hypothetical protein